VKNNNEHTMSGTSAICQRTQVEMIGGAYTSDEFPTEKVASYRAIIYLPSEKIGHLWEGEKSTLRRLVKKHGGTDSPAMYRDAYEATRLNHAKYMNQVLSDNPYQDTGGDR
jgi:hypothetical protein